MNSPNIQKLKRYAGPVALYAGLSTLLMSGCGDDSTRTVTERIASPPTTAPIPAPAPAPAPAPTQSFPPTNPNNQPAPTIKANTKHDFTPQAPNTKCIIRNDPAIAVPDHRSVTSTITNENLLYGYDPIFQGTSIANGKVTITQETRSGEYISSQAVPLKHVDDEPAQLLQFKDPTGSTVEVLVDAPHSETAFEIDRRAEITFRLCFPIESQGIMPGSSS